MPVASSFTAYTSGTFSNGCYLTFAMSNGFGVGETPYLQKPPTYPEFLAADCTPADQNHQFGIWADANDIIAQIGCPVPAHESSWGEIKTIYR